MSEEKQQKNKSLFLEYFLKIILAIVPVIAIALILNYLQMDKVGKSTKVEPPPISELKEEKKVVKKRKATPQLSNTGESRIKEDVKNYPFSLSTIILNSKGEGQSGITVKCGNCSSYQEDITNKEGLFSIKFSIEKPNSLTQVELLLFKNNKLIDRYNIPYLQSKPSQIQLSNEDI